MPVFVPYVAAMAKQMITFLLDNELVQGLDALAEADERSRSWEIREAVRALLAQREEASA